MHLPKHTNTYISGRNTPTALTFTERKPESEQGPGSKVERKNLKRVE